jgi:hypothetical protein
MLGTILNTEMGVLEGVLWCALGCHWSWTATASDPMKAAGPPVHRAMASMAGLVGPQTTDP